MYFCKGKFSKVVHISKEDLEYYNIFFNRNNNKKFRDLSDIFQYYNKKEAKNKTKNEKIKRKIMGKSQK
jgi:hypothetical protein